MKPIRDSQPVFNFSSLLRQLWPHFNSLHFWLIQCMVIGIGVLHGVFEYTGVLSHLGRLYFVPISLFFVPIVYAAITFGFAGSLATAVWVVIISFPNLFIWHAGLERMGEIFQMGVLIVVAAFLGHRVDREVAATHNAQTAGAELKAYAAYVVRAQEEERQRIARELHDDTIQTLAILCRRLDNAEIAAHTLAPGAAKEIREARETTEQVVKGLRDFARTLRPPILDDLGIFPSVRRLISDFSDRTGIKAELKLVGQERRLPGETELGLFRITQEALRNVEYHSGATSVTVVLTMAENEARLEVKDNGSGFAVPADLNPSTPGGRLGLLGMRERAQSLGGSFDLSSGPGGTTIIVVVSTPNSTETSA